MWTEVSRAEAELEHYSKRLVRHLRKGGQGGLDVRAAVPHCVDVRQRLELGVPVLVVVVPGALLHLQKSTDDAVPGG